MNWDDSSTSFKNSMNEASNAFISRLKQIEQESILALSKREQSLNEREKLIQEKEQNLKDRTENFENLILKIKKNMILQKN